MRWQAMGPDAWMDPPRWRQKALMETVDGAQRSFALMGANARVLIQSVDRLQATAQETGRRVHDTLATSISKLRDSVRRVA